MQRRREIAASPYRGAGDTWGTISGLVTATLEGNAAIEAEAVKAALEAAGGVGRMLIAGGHLESDALVLVAGDLHLSIFTVSGDAAIKLQENLNAVPGGASAEDFTLHLPPSGSLAAAVRKAAKGSKHLSADPPEPPAVKAVRESASVLNDDALASWAEEDE